MKNFQILLLVIVTLCIWPFCGPSHAAPAIVPDQSVMRMDDLGLYAVGYQLRGGPVVPLPVGWVGGFDDDPVGAANQPMGRQNGEDAWLMHPPWKGHTGVTFQDFTFRLPHVPKIILSGATALRTDAVGKSDGATFRVFVDGQKRLDVNRKDATWLPFTLDLTPDAGRTVTIRFETDPGPEDNSSFDFALWGNRQLALTGYTPPVIHHPAPPTLDLSRLISRQNGSVAPLSGFAETVSTRTSPQSVVLRAQGKDGTLEYRWTPGQKSDSLLGLVSLSAQRTGDQPYSVPLAGQAHLDWIGTATLTGSVLQGTTLTRTYQVGGQTAHVTITAHLSGKSLVLDIRCDKPLLAGLEGGDWGPTLRRQPVNIPYYSHPIWYLAHEHLFAGAFFDWTDSQASELDGTRAAYWALTNGTHNLVRERLVYTAAWTLPETLPNIPNPPSPYRAELSRRTVLDIWGGTFAGIAQDLHALAGEGLGSSVALIHTWQFGGYDNMLPKHMPANTGQGGNAGMAALVAEGKHDGMRVALHENYTDYYPNFPGFTGTDIALASDGARELAWFNPGTKIQSFVEKPSRMNALAATQGPQIVQDFGSNACYLDVLSAVPPWFHVDFQAGVPLAGEFAMTWNAHRKLWAYERKLHDGPVCGEGNNHWYWSGYLDGAEAQFGEGWPSGQGTSAPLLVDFDLLKMHPLELNHGMGYYERWWDTGPNDQRSLISFLDQYRMQEVAYGHEGFLGGGAWHDLGLAWLESHLMTPLTARTAQSNPKAIDYWVNGAWKDITSAIMSGRDFSRVRVRYANGLTIWANSGASSLKIGSVVLPQYGWLAQGDGLTDGTTLRAGLVSDMSDTPDSVFVNARPTTDWLTSDQVHVQPTVAAFTSTGPRSFRVTYQWRTGQTLTGDDRCFVHFVDPRATDGGDDIIFQQDHTLATPTSQWKPGQTVSDGPWNITVPATLAPGDYRWTIGLLGGDGERLTLQGQSDPHQRIILGTLHLAANGDVSFTPIAPAPPSDAPVNADDRVLDFGAIRTNGSVFLQHVGQNWILRPFPVNRPFTVLLSAARFGHPASVPVVGGWWTLKLTGAATYQWPAKPRHGAF